MPTKTESTARETTPSSSNQDDAISQLAALSWMGSTWVEAISEMGSEVARFVAERISEDVKAQHALLHCKSLSEMHAVQAAFLERAYDQYTAETDKLLERGGAILPPFLATTKHTPV
ncbi:phasin family protein [Loktanella agnita]|uniref:phasin family protein n=1 Tax=Loktanella agnita TaxID=287097 RepID=UPI003988674F